MVILQIIVNMMRIERCNIFASAREIGFDSLKSQCMLLQEIGAQAYLDAWLVLAVRARVIGRLRLFDHFFNILNRSPLGKVLCISPERPLRFRFLGLSVI